MMRKLVPFLASTCLAGALGAVAAMPAEAGVTPAPTDTSWSLVFQDGFTNAHAVGSEYFQDVTKPRTVSTLTVGGSTIWRNLGVLPMSSCATVDTANGGILTLKPQPKWNAPDTMNCRLTSTAKFSGGTYTFAARVLAHKSTGHYSSFWLNTDMSDLAAARAGANEIDVFENYGLKSTPSECVGSSTLQTNQAQFFGLNHAYYSSYSPTTGYKFCLSSAATTRVLEPQTWHIFSAEWAPGQYLRYYIDGELSASYGPAAAKDSAINAILTNFGPAGTGKTFQVDWVKVWKKNPPPATCENDCWRARLGVQAYNFVANSNMSDPRLARVVFDRQFYINAYPDVRTWAQNKVATQGGNLLDHVQWHWLNYGIPWGRQGSATFDPIYYMSVQPDVSAAYGWNNYAGAISHYITYGRFEGRRASLQFDQAYYRARYGDLATMAPWQAVDHFTNSGLNEGRQGSAQFAPAWYLGVNPDVRNAFGGNNYRAGMTHWIAYGRAEGRPGSL